jgi:hypothetical protein
MKKITLFTHLIFVSTLGVSSASAADLVLLKYGFDRNTGERVAVPAKTMKIEEVYFMDRSEAVLWSRSRQLRIKAAGWGNDLFIEGTDLEDLQCVQKAFQEGLVEKIEVWKSATSATGRPGRGIGDGINSGYVGINRLMLTLKHRDFLVTDDVEFCAEIEKSRVAEAASSYRREIDDDNEGGHAEEEVEEEEEV